MYTLNDCDRVLEKLAALGAGAPVQPPMAQDPNASAGMPSTSPIGTIGADMGGGAEAGKGAAGPKAFSVNKDQLYERIIKEKDNVSKMMQMINGQQMPMLENPMEHAIQQNMIAQMQQQGAQMRIGTSPEGMQQMTQGQDPMAMQQAQQQDPMAMQQAQQQDPMAMQQAQQPNPMEVQAAVKKKLMKIAVVPPAVAAAGVAWTGLEAGKGAARLGLHATDKLGQMADESRIEANPTRGLEIRQQQFRHTQRPAAAWNWTGANIGALPGQRRLF